MLSKGEDNLKKKFIIILSALVVVLIVIGFLIYELSSIVYENPVIASLPQADTSDCYYSGGFQDYTDYCKYYYAKQENVLEEVKNNPYFKPVTPDDITELNSYFDNFEGWLECVEYQDKYDFQRNDIDTEDYFYIENDEISEKQKYWDYDVYFFDVQTQTLFFIHNNI